jgi:NAD(P)-dependent dehydrogenase (short-subunit alcohol dehydrogenase family)
MRLRGKIAIVTGSTRGIGRAIVERLASDGARVAVNGRDPRAVASVVAALRSADREAIGVAADVGLGSDVDRLFDEVARAFGTPDMIVNNAAVSGDDAVRHLLEMDELHWENVLRTNLTGAFRCTRRGAQGMVARGLGGSIVNVSSFSAPRAHRSMAAYDAAKGGLESFTRAAALDLAPHGIRVNAVGPGAIRSPEDELHGRAAAEERARTVPLGRLGEPTEVAAAVAFLVSDDAAYVTGQVLYVDGGMLAQLRPPQVDPQTGTMHDRDATPRP